MIRSINTLRRFAFGAIAALAMFAGSAQVQAQTVNPTGNSFIASIADYTGSTANRDYARDYAVANAELRDGKLIGCAYSTGSYQFVKGRTCELTPMQRRVMFDNGSGDSGRPASEKGS